VGEGETNSRFRTVVESMIAGMRSQSEKVALVTGGASGIGQAIAQTFAYHGIRVAIIDIDEARGKDVATELSSSGSYFIHADVSHATAATKAVDTVSEHFGRIDIVVNNAGIVGGGGAIEDITIEQMREVIGTNLEGPLWICSRAAWHMKKQGSGGSIVNIGSIAAIRGAPYYPIYSATKAALIGLTKSLANQLGSFQIRVNCICPGSIGGTGLMSRSCGRGLTRGEILGILHKVPLRCIGRPQDVANLVFFLSSEKAAFINSAIIVADGGEYGEGEWA